MPKMKTHKGLKKRLKISANGKVRHKRPFASHLMSGKSGNRVRHLRKPRILHPSPLEKRIKSLLGEA